MVQVGETVMIRKAKTLFDGCKDAANKRYLYLKLLGLVESMDDLVLMEVTKRTSRKFQLDFIMTTDNTFDIREDKIFFTPSWYDLKPLNAAVETKYFNEFLGDCTELRVPSESEEQNG